MSVATVGAAQKNRASIFVEDGEVLQVRAWPDDQYVMRIAAARCAGNATAGSFVHLQCSPYIPMRRPLSIMRADAAEGWIDILFKIVGDGLRALSQAKPGSTLSVLGPIGHGFTTDPSRPRAMLIGGGVGIPPMIYLAESLTERAEDWQPLVLMGSEIPFPFALSESSLPSPWLDPAIRSTLAELESQGICARLASLAGFEGCYEGYVTDLGRACLQGLESAELAQSAVYACGPTPMLRAVARLAEEFGLPCQVSLEEFMACAVGGCAGCAVPVHTADGVAMKRVCVDGPVFDAAAVFPATG